uniref:hypothetical protein n=1 Tax=Pseudomonas putida TaxID=303 RepID=UPI001ED92176
SWREIPSYFRPSLAPYVVQPSTSDGLNPKLLGLWYEKYQYPQRNGIVGFEGTTQFFRNKTYRINGRLQSTTFSPVPLSPLTTIYNFDGNGEWQASDDELVIKLLSVRMRIAATLLAGTTFKVPDTWRPPNAEETALEQSLLMAQSQRYDIRSTNKSEVVLETNGLYADSYLIHMTRTKQMYTR